MQHDWWVGSRGDYWNRLKECPTVTEKSDFELSDDISIINAARDGNREAFGQLYDRYARMVHGILLARVPASDVEDLVQDVFLLALPRIRTLRDVSRFAAWLAAIARNRANDHYRRSNTASQLTEAKIGTGGTSHHWETDATFVLAAIRSLPDAYRETLILRLVEGMTGPEIAARTGLTPGSVRVNLYRGMQQLRQRLGTTVGEREL